MCLLQSSWSLAANLLFAAFCMLSCLLFLLAGNPLRAATHSAIMYLHSSSSSSSSNPSIS
jgi:hypothetical protein